MNLRMSGQEILDLYRIQVLTAGNNNIFLTVDKENKSVLILHGHIAGVQPAILDCFSSSFGVMIVAAHHARAFYAQLAYLSMLNGFILLSHDLALPSIAGNADSANLVHIFHPQMHAAGTGRFRQAIVRIILMMREILEPVPDQGRRQVSRGYAHGL